MYRKQTGVFSRLALLSSLSLTYSSTITSFSSPQTSPFIFLPFSFLLPLLNLPSPFHSTSSLFSSSSFTSSSNFSVQLPPLFLPPPSPLPSLLHLLLSSSPPPTLPFPLPPGPSMYPLPSALRCCLLICNTQRPSLQCMWRHHQTMGHQGTLSKTGKTRFTRQHMHV